MPRARKQHIPAALKQAIWNKYNGVLFEAKCHVSWCKNIITPFTFEAGHNIPESKGGPTSIDNLIPICHACNRSMGDRFTIDEFSELFGQKEYKNNTVVPEIPGTIIENNKTSIKVVTAKADKKNKWFKCW